MSWDWSPVFTIVSPLCTPGPTRTPACTHTNSHGHDPCIHTVTCTHTYTHTCIDIQHSHTCRRLHTRGHNTCSHKHNGHNEGDTNQYTHMHTYVHTCAHTPSLVHTFRDATPRCSPGCLELGQASVPGILGAAASFRPSLPASLPASLPLPPDVCRVSRQPARCARRLGMSQKSRGRGAGFQIAPRCLRSNTVTPG